MVRKGLIIAIDGPAGSGKSTTARRVAERLGYLYINTGAMYRAMTLKALRENIRPGDEDALGRLVDRTSIAFERKEDGPHVLLDGEDVTNALWSPELTANIAWVCKVPRVRQMLVIQQRAMGCEGGVVMEGRDIGTVVFPHADIKVFLDASLEERVRRREKELAAQGVCMSSEEVRRDLSERDRSDRIRDHGPLRPAQDAIRVDTTDRTIAQQVDRVLELAQKVRAERGNGSGL